MFLSSSLRFCGEGNKRYQTVWRTHTRIHNKSRTLTDTWYCFHAYFHRNLHFMLFSIIHSFFIASHKLVKTGFFFFFFFWGLHLRHMEVSGPGVELELQLLSYITATATPDLSLICELHLSLWPCQFLNSLNKATDPTHILMDTSWVLNPPSHNRNSYKTGF